MAEHREPENAGGVGQVEAAPGGVGSWIMGIFLDPKPTFEGIAARANVPHPTDHTRTTDKTKWWLPMVIFAVILAGMGTYMMFSPAGVELIEQSMRDRGVPEEGMDQALAMARGIGLPIQIIVIAIIVLLIVFLSAGISHGVARAVGGKGLFRHARAVVCWTLLIGGLGAVVKLLISMITGKVTVEMSPSIFFPGLEPSSLAYRFLNTGFDIFTIWQVVAMTIGLAVAYRLTRGKAVIPAVVSWVASTAIGTLLSQGGSFGGM